jgi:hypothetical protein
MSVQSMLTGLLVHERTGAEAEQIAKAMLAEHAHELAERIRNSEELRDYTDDHMGDCLMAADLIDPKKESNAEPDGR